MTVLPISAFVAAVYVTNRLSSDSEMVVLQTAGASSTRIARPVFYFGVMVALLVAILAHLLVPAARSELSGRSAEISRDITARFLKDLLVRGDTGPRLVMFDGLAQTFRPSTGRLTTIEFEDFAYDIGALMRQGGTGIRDLRELPTGVLLNPSQEDLDGATGDLADFLYEAHDRVARSLLAIVVPMMGFAALMVGGFSRFGVWRQVVLAVVMIIGVQLVANSSEEVARGDARLFWLAYLAPLAGTVLTALLLCASQMRRFRGRDTGGDMAQPSGAAQ